MKLYIAGPMRGYPDHNYPAFFAAEKQLQAAGYETLNPARHGQDASLRQHFLWDIEDLTVAEGIALLPGHEHSEGANCEEAIGGMLGLRTHKINEWLTDPLLRPQRKQRIVAFTGYKGSGKDTAAAMLRDLCESQGMTTARRGFADALKDEVCEFFEGRASMARDEMDDPAKKERYRLGLQWWGTEIRRAEDPEYWIKKMRDWIKQCSADVITITDVRFENEAEMVRSLGGVLVCVQRASAYRADDHASERGVTWVSDTDLFIKNDGTLEALQDSVAKLRGVLWVEAEPKCPECGGDDVDGVGCISGKPPCAICRQPCDVIHKAEPTDAASLCSKCWGKTSIPEKPKAPRCQSVLDDGRQCRLEPGHLGQHTVSSTRCFVCKEWIDDCKCVDLPPAKKAPNHYAPPVLGSEREYAEMCGLCPPSVKSEPAPIYRGPLPGSATHRCEDCGAWLEDCKCA